MGSKPTTILQIIPKLDVGGAELAVVEIARAVTSAGGRALVLAEPGRLTAKVEEAGGKVIAFPAATKNPIQMLANTRTITRFVGDEGIDLVHARSRAPAWSGLMAARRTGVPFVTTYHGAYNEKSSLKRLYNSVMARGDVVIANSEYTARLIADRYQTPTERLVVIHRGVDPQLFDPARVSPARLLGLRTRWGLAPTDKVILQAARLTSWKGQSVLIDAAAQLAASGDLAQVVVILAGDAQGRDKYREDLLDRIAALGLQDRVRLVGHVDDIAAAFVIAHVTVVASTEPEAFGRSAIEAAAMGSPVIATNIGAPPETVLAEPRVARGEITGWLVPPSDAGQLAADLRTALTMSSENRTAMGARARKRAASAFSVAQMQEKTLQVYDRLLGSNLAGAFAKALT